MYIQVFYETVIYKYNFPISSSPSFSISCRLKYLHNRNYGTNESKVLRFAYVMQSSYKPSNWLGPKPFFLKRKRKKQPSPFNEQQYPKLPLYRVKNA